MSTDDNSDGPVVPSQKTLALSESSNSKNAFCVSSYGAFQAVCMLSPKGIREVFCDTNPEELLEIADGVNDNIRDRVPHESEGHIKDLAFKREVLIHMAEENSEKPLTVWEGDNNPHE
jgi:hypothetical protein